MADRFASRGYSLKNKLGDRMIKQLLNSVIAKYRDLLVSRRSIICLSVRLRQIIDLLATDKSRCFAQLHPIIANYWQRSVGFRSLDLQDEGKDKNNAHKGCAPKETKINYNKEMLLISLLQTFIRRTLVSVGWFVPYDAWSVIITVMQASLQINKAQQDRGKSAVSFNPPIMAENSNGELVSTS